MSKCSRPSTKRDRRQSSEPRSSGATSLQKCLSRDRRPPSFSGSFARSNPVNREASTCSAQRQLSTPQAAACGLIAHGGRAICAAVISATLGLAPAFAADECTGVTACASVPEMTSRIIHPNDADTVDLFCPAGAPYLWNWDVVTEGSGRPSRMTEVHLVKVLTDQSGLDNGVRLNFRNSDSERKAQLRTKLGCSTTPFPYQNAVRRTYAAIGESHSEPRPREAKRQ